MRAAAPVRQRQPVSQSVSISGPSLAVCRSTGLAALLSHCGPTSGRQARDTDRQGIGETDVGLMNVPARCSTV